MRNKPITYSQLAEYFGINNANRMRSNDADSLAALTHFLQLPQPLPSQGYLARITPSVRGQWAALVAGEGMSSPGAPVPMALPVHELIPAEVKYDVPFPPPKHSKFTFVDLFAGIGGMRIAFQAAGGRCVFTSEIDPWAKQSYAANFGEVPFGDITSIEASEIPDHDVLVGGFPCQAFSIAGKRLGFEEARGTLFFDIARIIAEKRPKAFFLENVKGLTHHRGGETLRVILRILREELDYHVPDPQIVNAKFYGVPQNRERIFIVGFREKSLFDEFVYPNRHRPTAVVRDILESQPVASKYYLSERYLNSMREHRRRHEAKGHGFGYEIIDPDAIANAIVVGGMGRERNLIVDDRLVDRRPTTNIVGEINREYVRRMTPREWARLQGFPDKFEIVVSDAQAYKQFGNSVAVPAVGSYAKVISRLLTDESKRIKQRR